MSLPLFTFTYQYCICFSLGGKKWFSKPRHSESYRFKKVKGKETFLLHQLMKHNSVDLVIVTDCSVRTTFHFVYTIQRAIKDFIKWSLEKNPCIGKDIRIAFIKCSVWPEKGVTIQKTAFINEKDAMEREAKKIKSQSLKKRPKQMPVDCESMSKVLMEVQQMHYREDAVRLCIYVGECCL